ncbi:hypothetical protein ABG067_008128, partial [Albugo candida]
MAEKNHKSARSLKWTKEEDKKLGLAVKIFGNCNWQQVADMLKGRTGQQCLQRWTKSINPAIVRTRWSPEESELLKRAVKLYGAGNWSKVQRLLPGRTDMQCRERYVNIEQAVNKNKMTTEEIDQVVALVNEVGPKWSYISSFFPGRTDNFILKEYHNYINKGEKEAKKKGRKPKGKKRKEPEEVENDDDMEVEPVEEEGASEAAEASATKEPAPAKKTNKKKKRKSKDQSSDSDTEDEYKPPPVNTSNNARR